MQQFPADGQGERLEGVVSQWNGSWGFVQFTDGRRAYVHNSACGGSSLIEGQTITGSVIPDPRNDGKWQAVDVELQSALAGDNSGRMAGVVTQWHSTYGFAQFSDGRRAYVHHSACGGMHLAEGQSIVGLVVEDQQNPGKWQAQEVELAAPAGPTAAAIAEDRVQGQVVQWSSTFGFINCSDGRRAYVHSSQVNGAALTEGDAVVARIVEDPKNLGKWQAVEVERLWAGAGAQVPPHVARKLQGQVAQWSGSYGFVQFADGRRAYVHSSQCGGVTLSEGDDVFANIAEDTRNPGKWQATDVSLAHAAGRPAVPAPPAPAQWHQPQQWQPQRELPPPTQHQQPQFLEMVAPHIVAIGQRPPANGQHFRQELVHAVQAVQAVRHDGRIDGTVTQWNGEKGFGFAELVDGRRAYVHNSSCGGAHLQEGEIISAMVMADSKNSGKWAAQLVRRGATEQEVGSVAEWREEGGYGFVQLEDGRRAYIHRSAFGGAGSLAVGTRLAFTIKEDSRNPGKWCIDRVIGSIDEASGAVMPLPEGASGPLPPAVAHAAPVVVLPPPTGQPQVVQQQASTRSAGVVAEWNSRGFGFVTLDDGTRAYVHNSQCGGEHLQQGERVTADVVPDERTPGKWQAHNVSRECSGQSGGEEPAAKRQRSYW